MRRKPQPFISVALLAGVTIVLTVLVKFPRIVTESVPLFVSPPRLNSRFMTPFHHSLSQSTGTTTSPSSSSVSTTNLTSTATSTTTTTTSTTTSTSQFETFLSNLNSSIFYNNTEELSSTTCTLKNSSQFNAASDMMAIEQLITNSTMLPESIVRYSEWHAIARACLERSILTDEQRLNRTGTECKFLPPVLVYRCLPGRLCAGVGDRLRGIIGTFLLSVATRRLFFIDWKSGHHSPFDLTTALIPASIDWTLPNFLASPELSDRFSQRYANRQFVHLDWYDAKNWNALSSPDVDRKLDLLSDDFNAITAHISNLAISCNAPYRLFIYALRDNRHLRHSVPDLTPERIPSPQLFRTLISTLFRPTQLVASLVATHSFRRGLLPVAVHVRTGADFQEDAPRLRRKTRGHLLTRALWACAQRVSKNSHLVSSRGVNSSDLGVDNENGLGTRVPSRMFIAGDDQAVKYGIVKHGLNSGMKPEHIRISSSMSMHIGLPSHKAPQNATDKCVAFVTIFADLLLMARASVLITSGSGFAKAAAYFGNVQELWIASVMKDGSPKCKRAQLD